jgi:osmotically inducible lipoprotein OsmB
MRTIAVPAENKFMRKLLLIGVICASIFASTSASADERKLSGAAIGAGAGAIVAGPAGAVAGVIVGAWLGGPRITGRSYRACWYDHDGRHCRWR